MTNFLVQSDVTSMEKNLRETTSGVSSTQSDVISMENPQGPTFTYQPKTHYSWSFPTSNWKPPQQKYALMLPSNTLAQNPIEHAPRPHQMPSQLAPCLNN